MNFNKLFGKKDKGSKPQPQDKNQQTQLMLDQKIKEQELRISNIETKTNALQEEAKAKLKQGDKAGAKRILAKKKKYVDQIKQIEGAMAIMEEQKMMLESALSTKDMMNAIKAGTGPRFSLLCIGITPASSLAICSSSCSNSSSTPSCS